MAQTALEILLLEAHRSIPPEILRAVFGRKGIVNQTSRKSIDQCLYDLVWKPITLAHINLNVGRPKNISMKPSWRIRTQPMDDSIITAMGYCTGFYQVPPEAREYSDIVAIESLEYNLPMMADGMGGIGDIFSGVGNSISNMNAASLEMHTHRNYVPQPQATITNSNIVEVSPDQIQAGIYYLRCLLNYNCEFTNADPVLIEPARHLFLADVKAFIYTHLDIPTDTTAVVGGMEIGRLKDRLMSYESAETEREAALATLRGQVYNDPKTQTRLLTYLTG